MPASRPVRTLVRWTLDELVERVVDELLSVNGAAVIVAAPSPEEARIVYDAACRDAAGHEMADAFRTRGGTGELLFGNRVARFVDGATAVGLEELRPTLAIVFAPYAHRNITALAVHLSYACMKCGGAYHEVVEPEAGAGGRGGRRGRR